MNENRYINARTLKQDLVPVLGWSERERVMMIIDAQKAVDVLDRDNGAEPLLEGHTSAWHEHHADGHGEFHTKTNLDWTCPKCGWFVGELYCGHGRWHIQQTSSYCARCGQKIDWTKPSDEEKRRYEERKAREREEWERKNGCKLDNMYEHLRKKYLRE